MEEGQIKTYERIINRYKRVRPTYENYTDILKTVLKNIVQGCSSEYVLQARTKSISSFANTLFGHNEPSSIILTEIDDLTGLRVIVPNSEELNTICDLINKNFIVIKKVSNEVESDSQFGELKLNLRTFIIKIKSDLELYNRLNLHIPEKILDLKAEIQIRTFLSHGWASNQYYIKSKSEFKVPKPYEQELNRVASLLDVEDKALNELMKKMRDYESSYGAYMSPEDIEKEIKRLDLIYDADKTNFEIGHRIAKLALAVNDLDKAIEILEDIINLDGWNETPELKMAIIYRDLGIAYYKKHKNNPNGTPFEKGQRYLKISVQKNPSDSDAWSSLGGSYKEQKNYKRALECYKKALEVNPGDPYPLGNYLILNIQQSGDILHIERNRDMIQKGIKKRLKQAEVMVDIPWAFFDLGLFNLFLGKIYSSLDYYLKAIRYSQDIWMIETTINTLENLKIVHHKLPGIKYVKYILLLGILAHPKRKKISIDHLNNFKIQLERELSQKEEFSDRSIVIVAGGTDSTVEREIENYNRNLIDAFKDYEGVIISGGTKSGIAKIVGNIQTIYQNKVKTVGYIPKHIPSTVEIDKRYSRIHITEGTDFSVLEPIQYWYDILKSDVEPNKVKLIGINGGRISAFEFHMAIIFGAQVGIIENSGRAASDLINDKSWEESFDRTIDTQPKKLFKVIRNSSKELYNFLTRPFIIDSDIESIEKLLIQHVESGVDVYKLDFKEEEVDNTLLSGFLTALDNIAREALNVGEILSIKFLDGYLTGGLFEDKNFKIVFLLNRAPSQSLEKKIVRCIKEIEEKFGSCFKIIRQSCQIYPGGPKMNNILSKIFGNEILKLIDIKNQNLKNLPPECL